MRYTFRTIALLSALSFSNPAAVKAQSFYPLSVLPGSTPNTSYAYGLTAAGDLAVGQSGASPYIWSAASGMIALPIVNGTTGGIARNINAGGSVAAGDSLTTVGHAANHLVCDAERDCGCHSVQPVRLQHGKRRLG